MLDRINVRSWIGPHCEIQVNYLDSVRDWKSWCLASIAETKSCTFIHCSMPKVGRPFHSQGMRRPLQYSVVVSKRMPLDYTPSLLCDAIAVALWLLVCHVKQVPSACATLMCPKVCSFLFFLQVYLPTSTLSALAVVLKDCEKTYLMLSSWRSGSPVTSSWFRTSVLIETGKRLKRNSISMGISSQTFLPGANFSAPEGVSKDAGRSAAGSEAPQGCPGQQENSLFI